MANPWEEYDETPPWEEFEEKIPAHAALRAGGDISIPKELGKRFLKALDWPGGMLQTAGAYALGRPGDLMSKDPEKKRAALAQMKTDFENALMGEAPATSEYLERGGYKPGPKEGLLYDILGRGVPELIAGGLPGAKHLFRAGVGSVATKEAGEALSKSAYKKLDEFARQTTGVKRDPSDVWRKYGIKGSARKMKQKTRPVLNKLTKERDRNYYKEITKKGVEPNMSRAFVGAKKTAWDMKMEPDRAIRAEGDRLLEKISAFEEDFSGKTLLGRQPIKRADVFSLSKTKSRLYDDINSNAYRVDAKTPMDVRTDKIIADSLKTEIENMAEVAGGKPLRDNVKRVNEEIGAIVHPQKKLSAMAMAEAGRPMVSQIDLPLMRIDRELYALKQLAKLGGMPGTKTTLGDLISGAGELGLPSMATRRVGTAMQDPYTTSLLDKEGRLRGSF